MEQQLLQQLEVFLAAEAAPYTSEVVRSAALGCVAAVLGTIHKETAERELVPFLAGRFPCQTVLRSLFVLVT